MRPEAKGRKPGGGCWQRTDSRHSVAGIQKRRSGAGLMDTPVLAPGTGNQHSLPAECCPDPGQDAWGSSVHSEELRAAEELDKNTEQKKHPAAPPGTGPQTRRGSGSARRGKLPKPWCAGQRTKREPWPLESPRGSCGRKTFGRASPQSCWQMSGWCPSCTCADLTVTPPRPSPQPGPSWRQEAYAGQIRMVLLSPQDT